MGKMRYLFLMFTFFSTFSVSSKSVNENVALKVASNFASQYFAGTKSVPILSLAYTCSELNTKALPDKKYYYVYNVNSNGFLIISGDDSVFPVLGYSYKGLFNQDSIPDNFCYWLNEYKKQIQWAMANELRPTKKVMTEWNILQSGNPLSTGNTEKILNTAQWNQTKPYYNQCPMDGTKRCPTGCVATAMGILMKYHKWPLKGTGNHSYVSKTLNKALYADFEIDYDWNNTLSEYKSEGTTNLWDNEQAWNVSMLLYNCGVASEMDYTGTSSGAYTFNAVKGMIDNFGYDKSMRLLPRKFYDDKIWAEMIRNEIDNSRPVMYGGTNENQDGHQFVLDGYNSNSYYHVNWGWGGLSNGYFLLNALDPDSQGAGGNGSGFSVDQELVTGIKKADANSDYITNLYLTSYKDINGMSMVDNTVEVNKEFNVSIVAYNYCLKGFAGYVGVGLVNESNDLKEVIGAGKMSSPLTFRYLVSFSIPCKITTNILSTYKLQPFYSDDGIIWKRIPGSIDTVNELAVNIGTSISNLSNRNISYYLIDNGNTLKMSLPSDSSINRIVISDIQGQKIKDVVLNSAELSVSLYGLSKGVYVISIYTKSGIKNYKFMK